MCILNTYWGHLGFAFSLCLAGWFSSRRPAVLFLLILLVLINFIVLFGFLLSTSCSTWQKIQLRGQNWLVDVLSSIGAGVICKTQILPHTLPTYQIYSALLGCDMLWSTVNCYCGLGRKELGMGCRPIPPSGTQPAKGDRLALKIAKHLDLPELLGGNTVPIVSVCNIPISAGYPITGGLSFIWVEHSALHIYVYIIIIISIFYHSLCWLCMCIYIYIHTRSVPLYIYVHMFAYMYIYIYMQSAIRIYIYIYMYIYIYVNIYIYI